MGKLKHQIADGGGGLLGEIAAQPTETNKAGIEFEDTGFTTKQMLVASEMDYVSDGSSV